MQPVARCPWPKKLQPCWMAILNLASLKGKYPCRLHGSTAPETLPVNEDSNSHPLVTVCLMHFERPPFGGAGLILNKENKPIRIMKWSWWMMAALKMKTLHKLEIFRGNNLKKNGWRIVRQQNCLPGGGAEFSSHGCSWKISLLS